MKKKLFVLFLAFVLLGIGQAQAMMCEQSQALHGPDACWTKVTLSSSETTLVSQGHALVWHMDDTTPKQGAYQVVLSSASTQGAIVAGFAQGTIASGDTALILVRGFGFVRTVGGVASSDLLMVTASGNVGVTNFISNTSSNSAAAAASTYPAAVALDNSTTNGTTARQAYIRVV